MLLVAGTLVYSFMGMKNAAQNSLVDEEEETDVRLTEQTA